jgi:drug/metabolite transporter (DMT)-like permease
MTKLDATPPTLSMTRHNWAMLLILSVLWGGSFFFQGVAVRELPTLSIVTLRVAIAALVLWGVVLVSGRAIPRDPKVWIALFGMGALNNVIPYSLIVWGQHSIESGLASILNATTPLFTVLVAGLMLADERFSRAKLAGVGVGFGGAFVMIGPDVLSGLGQDLLAQLACLAGAMSYACAGVFGRRFRRMGIDPVVVAAGQVSTATLLLLPVVAVVDQPWDLAMPSAAAWAAVICLAVLSTAVAYVLYFRILAQAGATNLLLVTFLIPVTGILLGSLVLGERLLPVHGAGMALIGIGLALIDGRLFRR